MYKTEIIPIGRAKDITGERFGRLLAVGRTHNIGKYTAWLCECDCGNITSVIAWDLLSGHTRSCGCLRKGVDGKDLTGQRFGRLLAVKPTDKRAGGSIVWELKCDCGNIAHISTRNLRNGDTRSCGCLKDEFVGKNHPNYNPNRTDEERLKDRYILGEHTIYTFRNKVYQRDDYTCQICGQVGGTLNSHHLDGWNWAKDKRFEISNGVTLCEDCHNKFHNEFGRGNNTKEQFEEFKNKMITQTNARNTRNR